MALTYQSYAGNKRIKEAVLIARNGEQNIYYIDEEIDILRENEPEEAVDIVSELVDEAAKELQIHNISTTKLNELDLDIYGKTCPTGRKERKIFNEVKNKLSAMEAKMYYPKKGDIKVVPTVIEDQRNAIYISGQAGSGKSWWAADYALEYQKIHPGNMVFLISRKKEDKAFDKVPSIIRIALNRQFIKGIKRVTYDEEDEEQEPIEKFRDSLIIFDDFEQISDPAIHKAVMEFKNDVFTLGRQYNIDIISIQHKSLGGQKSVTDLSEANTLVCFPKANLGETTNLLSRYCKYTPDQIERILDEETKRERWMCIIRPKNILMTKRFIKIL